MPREVKEWIGKNDDAMPPPSVFNRLYRKQNGICPECTRELKVGNITRDHIKALIFGGENRERNLRLICTNPCSLKKSGDETRRKAKADRCLNRDLGLKVPTRRPVPGSKASRIGTRWNKHEGKWETYFR